MKKANSLFSDALKVFKKNKIALVSLCFILFISLLAIFAEFFSPYAFDEQNMDLILQTPSLKHPMGTDSLGRDLLSRMIYGARMSMAIGIFTALISLVLGLLYGGISGWMGGWVDSILMRIVDILYSIPTMVLLIIVKVIFDAFEFISHPEWKALLSMLFSLSVVSWVALARIVRGQVLQIKEFPFIESAKASGLSSMRIFSLHMIPNILGPIIVLLTFQIPSNILAESFLSFIGLGLQPPFSSWGVLANEGWRSLRVYPHLMIFPSSVLFLSMLAFNFLGDAIRDAFDPQMKKPIT